MECRPLHMQGPGGADLNYTDDMAGRMLTRTSGGVTTTFLWDGWDCIRESTLTSTTHDLIPEGQLLGFRRDGEPCSLASDALGCVCPVTDSSGEVVLRRDYAAWGETLPGGFDNVPGGMPYSFVGGLGVRTDVDTGLMCMRQRWYDPTLQRFISRDPIGLSGGRNLYAYAWNSPSTYVDPLGLLAESKNVTCEQLRRALRAAQGRMPLWVLGLLAGQGNNSDSFIHRFKKEVGLRSGLDGGVPPTRARPANEAYLHGLIPDPMPGTGGSFWELSPEQRATAFLILGEKHPEVIGPILRKLDDVDGNLDTGVRSLDQIGRAMYGRGYPDISDEQWIDVVVQHDQGGPFGEAGYFGDNSQKRRLRDEHLRNIKKIKNDIRQLCGDCEK